MCGRKRSDDVWHYFIYDDFSRIEMNLRTKITLWLTDASDGTSHQIVAVCVVFCAGDNIVNDVCVYLTTTTTSHTVAMHSRVIDNLANFSRSFRGIYNPYSSGRHGPKCTEFGLGMANHWQPSGVKNFFVSKPELNKVQRGRKLNPHFALFTPQKL